MRVAGTIFALAFIINSLDLSDSAKDAAVFPSPLEIFNVHRYESCVSPYRIWGIAAGLCYVGTDKDYKYIIGLVVNRHLCSFVVPLEDSPNTHIKVKIRIGINNNASEIVPILKDDPLNKMFHEIFEARHTYVAFLHRLH